MVRECELCFVQQYPNPEIALMLHPHLVSAQSEAIVCEIMFSIFNWVFFFFGMSVFGVVCVYAGSLGNGVDCKCSRHCFDALVGTESSKLVLRCKLSQRDLEASCQLSGCVYNGDCPLFCRCNG